MQAAVSTACLFPMQTEEALETLGKNGIRDAEIFLNAPSETTADFARTLKNIRDAYGMKIHAVHAWTAPMEGFMLVSRYPRRCDDFLEDAKHTFELMQMLSAPIYVFHGAMQGFCKEIPFYCERYQKLCALGHSFGVTVTHENVNKYIGADLPFLTQFCTILGDDARLTLDVKQAFRAGLDLPETIRTLAPHIAHIHISDHGETGDCLRIGHGSYDIPAFLSLLQENRYEGAVVLELYRDAFHAADELADDYRILQQMLHTPSDLSQKE